MNEKKLYDALCKKGNRRILEKVPKGKNHADHHIVPKSHGGGNDRKNIARLTFREHFLAHWLLFRLHPNDRGMAAAFKLMCGKNVKGSSAVRVPSRAYSDAVKLHAEGFSSIMKKKHSEKDSAGRSVKGLAFSKMVHSEKTPDGKSIHALTLNSALHAEKLPDGRSKHAVKMGMLGAIGILREKDDLGRPLNCVKGGHAVHSVKNEEGKSKHAVDSTRMVWKCCNCQMISHAMGIGRHHKSNRECAKFGKVKTE